VRQEQRTPTASAESLPPEMPAGTATPSDQAISTEEAALLWRALDGIPDLYREPMVLYYREDQSTQAVAEALDLSEELVRQRLSRGREMLSERLAKTIEMALLKSAPGKTFTLGVLAALPVFTISAKAASVGAAAKGGAAAKTAGWAGLFHTISGPVLSIVIPYMSYRFEMAAARSPEARQFIRQFFRRLFGLIVLFSVVVLLLMKFGKPLASSHPTLYAGLWIGLFAVYFAAALVLGRWTLRRQRTAAGTPKMAPPEPLFEYRSSLSLLGWPLVHIRLRGGMERGPVKAWFAAGDKAIGIIFAFGAIAIAPVSLGGIAIGLFSTGGFALGVVSFGGFAAAPWAMGAMVVGVQASGVCAVGWLSAQGTLVAVAHEFAQGGAALAAHANDAAAAAFFQNSHFFQNVPVVMRYVNWFYWLFFLSVVLRWRVMKKRLAAPAPVV